MSEVGGGEEGGELLHIYNSEASSITRGARRAPEGTSGELHILFDDYPVDY